MRDADALATDLALIVKETVSPLLERLAVTDTRLAVALTAQADLQREIVTLRERLAVAETKSVLPPPAVDLTPLSERMASAEARLNTLGDLRDRVVVVETKSAVAPPAVLPREPDPALADFRDRLVSLERKDDSAAVAAVRERVVALETRAPVPGPAGKDGVHGKDGANGQDGLGFDDLAVEFDGDRTMTLAFVRGEQRKAFPIALPYLRYQGVFTEGKTYDAGDVSTWAGASWHANERTTAKPGESKAWTLMVKKGRDGKDGRDAAVTPVVGLR